MKFKYPEGATPVDADEADELIPTHITIQSQLNEWEQRNILIAAAKHYNKKYSAGEILDPYFLMNLHLDMFGETWKWAGKPRTSEKNIGDAPERIRENLSKMLNDVKLWIEIKTYSEEEICIRFHRNLVAVHVFANGNGRHARFAADLLAYSLGVEKFTWGNKDLYHEGEARREYLKALKEADKGNYTLLIKFVRT